MKKAITILLALVLCLSLYACKKQNKDIIPAELALPAIPEVVGEWGSIFFAEESLITIREDGTCTILRQPGTWGVHKDACLWPTIQIVAQLENGNEEQIEFYMYQGDELGYHDGALTFLNSDIPTTGVVNRDQVLDPVITAPMILGTWVDGDSAEPFAVFNEDGTCKILGAKGLWGLNYAPYYNEDFAYGWDHYLYVLTDSGDSWEIHMSDSESGKFSFRISQGPLIALDTTEARNLDYQLKTEVVEITMDNWEQYFTLSYSENWHINEFNEYDDLKVDAVLTLKPEYLGQIANNQESQIVVEFHCDGAVKGANVDFEAQTYSIVNERKVEPIQEIHTITSKDLDTPYTLTQGELASTTIDGIQYIMVHENIVIDRIQGTLHLYAE